MAPLRLAALVLAMAGVGCSTSKTSGSAGACFKAGDRHCPNDPPITQADADACNKCLAKYQALLACDPGGGFTCLDGRSETSKDTTCKAPIDAFETCFIHSAP